MTRQIQRYQERVWEEVDPDTADRLREADTEVARKEEVRSVAWNIRRWNTKTKLTPDWYLHSPPIQMLKAMRNQIEAERESQETLLRDYRRGMREGGGGPLQRPSSASLHASETRR